MKTLILFGHNDLNKSMVSNNWLKHLKSKNLGDTTILAISELVKDGNFDTAAQREIIRQHDKILIIFPLYWYSHPSLLQKYLEQVLTGSDNAEFVNELRQAESKQLMIAVTAAAEQKNFAMGAAANFPLDVYLSNWMGLAKYCNMKFLPTFASFNVYAQSQAQLTEECEKMYTQFLTAKARN